MLLEGRGPAATLEALDLFATSFKEASCATVACAVIDRSKDLITYSRAGHPPPLVVGSSGVAWLDEATGPPLAVATRPRVNAVQRLHADDVIILYSDGLVERRGEVLDVGLGRLADAARDLYGSTVQRFADGLLRALLREPARDDVVLVVKHLPGKDNELH
jgi:serine phosphatase RsbU (regulator of sigma subunit)